jgi:hypothetical protein
MRMTWGFIEEKLPWPKVIDIPLVLVEETTTNKPVQQTKEHEEVNLA